jgi:hypothetical protein
MDFSRKYDYNPRPRLIALSFGVSALCIVYSPLVCGCRPSGIFLWAGLGVAAMGCANLARRLLFPRILTLDESAITLPSGFLRLRQTRVPYAAIRQVDQVQLMRLLILRIRTDGRSFEIVSGLLKMEEYCELRGLLFARLREVAEE